jgi:2'-5' RNA ligase
MLNDKEPVGKGYALWLMPEESMFSLLAGRISRLSQEFSTPLFEPHITLLSGVTGPEEESMAKCASLAGHLKPMRIELGDIEYSGEYFQCLFASVVPAEPIIQAHREARGTFDIRGEVAYTPHLSLLYGKLRIEAKKKIAAAHSFLSGQAFEVTRIELYRVNGPPREWQCAGEFDLR